MRTYTDEQMLGAIEHDSTVRLPTAGAKVTTSGLD
jgi:hypothetical protein